MHLVVTKLELEPDSLAAFQELFERRVPEVLGRRSSWRGAEMSIDPDANQALVVGYWEDETQMRESLVSPDHQELLQELAVHVAGPPDVTITAMVTRVGAMKAVS